jgi:mRNA interferase MazF
MVIIKGEIWGATLPSPRGSEPGKCRPVLVIQSDTFNRSSIKTVMCAIITSNSALSHAPGNILLEKADSKLDRTSVINFSQIVTIDKAFFSDFVTMLPKPLDL